MRFRCERDVLAEALATAGRAVTSRGSSLPVLSYLRLTLVGDDLEVTGTDLDLTISSSIKVAAEQEGRTVVPAKLALDIVRSLEAGAVTVGTEGNEATITGGRSEFSLHLYPVEEFPQPAEPSGDALTLEAAAFVDGLRQVVRAASTDDSRPILTGVLLAAEAGGLRLVATDSYRLAVRDLPGTHLLGEGQQVLVPSRALVELGRSLGGAESLTLVLGERDASFHAGTTRVTTRLIEGDFPNYRGLIPSSQPNCLTVGRSAVIEALKRVRLLAREQATPVRLTFSQDALELRAVTQDVGQASEQIDAKFEGADLTAAFNPDYLLDGLEVTPGDEVSLETVDSLKPALLRSTESADFLYLLMPVRVS